MTVIRQEPARRKIRQRRKRPNRIALKQILQPAGKKKEVYLPGKKRKFTCRVLNFPTESLKTNPKTRQL